MFDLASAFARLHRTFTLRITSEEHTQITRQLCVCSLRAVVQYSTHSFPQSCDSFDQRHGSITLVGSRTRRKRLLSCHVCNCYNLVSRVRVGNEIVTVSNAISSPEPSDLMAACACLRNREELWGRLRMLATVMLIFLWLRRKPITLDFLFKNQPDVLNSGTAQKGDNSKDENEGAS